ncbi:MAG: DNA polymerase III subunit alpha [Deltaproteobacteria bacterium]|nr:DNA polymerase III subunit alpha [Deltaproteobacteria bacterium]
MKPKDFVHLHVHSQYSLLHGAILVEKLIKQVKDFGLSAIALTDHANLFGAVEFYEKAKKEGIHPILGCEIYCITKGSRLERVKTRDDQLAHLLLLVQNAEGYKNLSRLLASAYNEGFYYKPRLDKEILKEMSAGLIALSCCSKGEIPRRIIEGKVEAAFDAAKKLSEIFPDRFYLELQDHGLSHETLVNHQFVEFSKQLNIPLVVTNNAHYLYRENREAHEALLCIQSGNKLSDEDRPSYDGEEYYLKSGEEMCELFKDFPEALENTRKIADSCVFDFDFKTYYFPKFIPPENRTVDDFFQECVWYGFDERWLLIEKFYEHLGKNSEERSQKKEEYKARIEFELKTILSMGFSSYFLIVSDFITYAKSQGIPVGPGRGSAAGSLVAFCLKITDIDPLPYFLLFERFLNPERISMPDMDIDFCMNRRDEVIAYVNQKYGNVSQIITFGKMKAKAVIRDVGRVLDFAYADVDKIAKLIPNALNMTLEEAMKTEPRIRELEMADPKVKKLLSIAKSLEGLNRHASTHAAGVVISDRPLTEFLPLYRGSNEEVVTQFDMKAVEKIGLVKFDFLGLKTLTVIENTLKIIKRTRGLAIRLIEISLDDEAVYQTLTKGDCLGIFQLESSGMRDLIVKLKPSCFEDLIALVALYRPGPLGSGMVDDFINRKHGRTNIVYDLPELESILKDTYGVIVYQEQVMQIASALAGFTLGDADLLRRAMGKKKPEEMAKQRERFIKGAKERNINIQKAEKIFDLMAMFAEYGFNKSHSAAYALISYQTAYLKTHFCAEYLASVLTFEIGDTDKVLTYINDLEKHNIAVLPPDINESYRYFSVLSDKEIRFGLAATKNVGDAAIESILEARKEKIRFENFFDFCESVDLRKVNRKVIESLIKCGAFDSLSDSLALGRSTMMEVLDSAIEYGAARQRDLEKGQSSLFDVAGEKSKMPPLPKVLPWNEEQKLKFEKEAMGFYVTGHPLKSFATLIAKLTPYDTKNLREITEKKEVLMAGVVTGLKEIFTKKGDRMAFATLEDLKGSVEVVVFSDVYNLAQTLLKSDDPLLIQGTAEPSEEAPKVLATRILSLKNYAGISQVLHIEMDAIYLTENKLKDFRFLLSKSPGNCPVYLHLLTASGKTSLKLPTELDVAWSNNLETDLQVLLGQKAKIALQSVGKLQ